MTWKIKATDAPKTKKKYAITLSWVLAIVMIGFAVGHLIRIDKLIPAIAEVLTSTGAMWYVVTIVIAEVFAVPYLLRIHLSPAMRIVSGILVVLVPLAWTCLAIWTIGSGMSTGQFSSYISTPGSWWLIVLNLIWLGASYWLLWLTNFDKVFAVLRKKS